MSAVAAWARVEESCRSPFSSIPCNPPPAVLSWIELTSKLRLLTLEDMLGHPRHKPVLPASCRGILDLLKVEGPSDSQMLAGRLGISPMAVRQHLYALQKQKLVTYFVEGRTFGRPAKVWCLAPAAEDLFPDMHAELCVRLLEAVSLGLGGQGLSRALAVLTCKIVQDFGPWIAEGDSFAEQLRILAGILSEQGFLAELQTGKDQTYLLIQNHCPIRSAAAACPDLCEAELEAFRRLLGRSALVERAEHIQAGARRCTYRIRNDQQPSA